MEIDKNPKFRKIYVKRFQNLFRSPKKTYKRQRSGFVNPGFQCKIVDYLKNYKTSRNQIFGVCKSFSVIEIDSESAQRKFHETLDFYVFLTFLPLQMYLQRDTKTTKMIHNRYD